MIHRKWTLVDNIVSLSVNMIESVVLSERKPGRPENVTAVQLPDNGGLLISWSPASHNSSSAAQYYVVEYRTVGPWVRLSGPLAVRAGRTPDFRWTTASRGATYHFRVRAYGADDVAGEPSDFVSLDTGGTVWSVLVYWFCSD